MEPLKTTRLFIKECEERGLNYILFRPHLLYIKSKIPFFCADSRTPLQTSAFAHIAKHKHFTKEILLKNNIPTAPWVMIDREDIFLPEEISGPFVAKPYGLRKGQGVVKGINDISDIHDYFKTHQNIDTIILEKELFGKEYRVLMIDKKVFSILERNYDNGKKTLIEVSDSITGDVKIFFEKIAEIFCTDLVGIDIIMEDITKVPIDSHRFGILELNSSPALIRHMTPDIGVGKNPAKAIFDLLSKKGYF